MKKNLAKRIVLGLLTGAVLMSSSVAWADDPDMTVFTSKTNGALVQNSINVGDANLKVGANAEKCTVVGVGAQTGGMALNSVVLGYGSSTDESRVVSVGYGGVGDDSTITLNGQSYVVPNNRRIVNVAKGKNANDAVNVGQLNDALENAFNDVDAISYDTYKNEAYNKYAVSVKTLKNVLGGVQAINDATYVKIKDDDTDDGKVVISENKGAQVTFEDTKVIFGTNSSWYEANQGFFAGGDDDHNPDTAKAALKEDGGLMGASGKFIVDGATGNLSIGDGTKATFSIEAITGNVTAQEVTATKLKISDGNGGTIDVETELGKKANSADVYNKAETYSQTEVDSKVDALKQVDLDLQTQINNIGGDNTAAIAGLNQRLEKTNAKINKVGAGAAALAALHPLDYDPDDKLTFSAGMGNYAGENAAALGAFYRPNEKFMVSLGGTMGNGENMVNLGLSIGLDKANGFAKMSKRELIQEVNAVKAENEAMKAEMAEMKAMLQELLAKK